MVENVFSRYSLREQNKLQQYFSGHELQKREEWINGAKQGEAKVRTIGAGISKIDYKGISVDGSQATVVVDVWTWAKYQDVKSGRIMNPSNAGRALKLL